MVFDPFRYSRNMNMCESVFYHIRDLRRIRIHLTSSTAIYLANVLVSSRLDFCNSLLFGCSKKYKISLQRVHNCLAREAGVGPGAVINAACLDKRTSRVRTPLWPSRFKEAKRFLPRCLVKIPYCGEPPGPRDTVLCFKTSGLEFRIMCLEGSVISFILLSSRSYPGPV